MMLIIIVQTCIYIYITYIYITYIYITRLDGSHHLQNAIRRTRFQDVAATRWLKLQTLTYRALDEKRWGSLCGH